MTEESGMDPGQDPYLAVTGAMQAGLLVTFNESTPNAPSLGELTVTDTLEDGTLYLKQSSIGSFEDTYYRFQADGNGGVEIVELDDEGDGHHWTAVETIEVVGIDG